MEIKINIQNLRKKSKKERKNGWVNRFRVLCKMKFVILNCNADDNRKMCQDHIYIYMYIYTYENAIVVRSGQSDPSSHPARGYMHST